jgi:hypothetical protein
MSHEMLELPPCYDNGEALQVANEQERVEESKWVDAIDPLYLVGGEAELSIRREADKKINSYRVRRVKSGERVYHFVDYKLGGDWVYIGIFNIDAKKVEEVLISTKAAKIGTNETPVKCFRYFVLPLLYGSPISRGFKLKHSGRCPRCGRELTSGKSLEHGIGPKCSEKVRAWF